MKTCIKKAHYRCCSVMGFFIFLFLFNKNYQLDLAFVDHRHSPNTDYTVPCKHLHLRNLRSI